METVCSFVEEMENDIKWKMKEIEGQLKGGVEEAKDKMEEIKGQLKEGVEDAKGKMNVISVHLKEEVECTMKELGQLNGGLEVAFSVGPPVVGDDGHGHGGAAAREFDFNRMAVVGGSMAVLGVAVALMKRF